MRTQKRRNAVHEKKPRNTAEKRVDTAPYKQADWAWTAARMLYALCVVVLALLPVGYSWEKLTRVTEVTSMAGKAISENTGKYWTPFDSIVDFLYQIGWKPGRAAWRSSGVDYGNTRFAAAAPGAPVYLAWQQSWKKLDAVPEGVTVLAPRWFMVESNGGTAVVNELGSLIKNKVTAYNPIQYVRTAHAGGAEVWAQVACLSQPDLARQLVQEGPCRSAFISRLAGWVSEYGLDGIDFDFEKMDPADKELFTALIRDVKLALPAGKKVSVCVTVPLQNPEGNWWQCYDREGLGREADYVSVMAYDNPDLEPIDAIDWVDGKVKMMLEAVPQHKILLGVPFFGVDLQFDAPPGDQLNQFPDVKKSKQRVTITPATIKKLLDTGTCTLAKKTVTVDYWIDKDVWSAEEGMAAYSFVDTAGTLHLMYCDDERSLAAKAQLLSYERLGGVAVWKLELGSDSFWSTLQQGLTVPASASAD